MYYAFSFLNLKTYLHNDLFQRCLNQDILDYNGEGEEINLKKHLSPQKYTASFILRIFRVWGKLIPGPFYCPII